MKLQNLIPLVSITHYANDIYCYVDIDEPQAGLIVDYYDNVPSKPSFVYRSMADIEALAYMNQIAGMDPNDTVYGVTGDLHSSYITLANTITPQYGSIYSRNTTLDLFALRLTGYFKAPTTGTYGFSSPFNNENLVIAGIGTVDCREPATKSAMNFQIFDTQVDPSKSTLERNVDMIAGNYYPIEIYYHAGATAAIFSFGVVYPDGKLYSTNLPFFYFHTTGPDSDLYVTTITTTTTITKYWAGSFTYTETIKSSGLIGTENFIITLDSDTTTAETKLSDGQSKVIVYSHPNTVAVTSHWGEYYISTTSYSPSGVTAAVIADSLPFSKASLSLEPTCSEPSSPESSSPEPLPPKSSLSMNPNGVVKALIGATSVPVGSSSPSFSRITSFSGSKGSSTHGLTTFSVPVYEGAATRAISPLLLILLSFFFMA